MDRSKSKDKPFAISKWIVWEAYEKVKANQGAAEVNGESIAEFEDDLKGNLCKIWNRMSSGNVFPAAGAWWRYRRQHLAPVANLFMHYAFDAWMSREFPDIPFERYVDDAVVHCETEDQALLVEDAITRRLASVGLEAHPDKTRIVYCKDDDRRGSFEHTSFDFLGYTFRPRLSKSKYGKHFVNFTPAVSRAAKKAINHEIRSWHLPQRSDKSLDDLAAILNPIIRGWIDYYGRFYPSMLYPLLRHINWGLVRWAMRKYKSLRGHKHRAQRWLVEVVRRQPALFAHWKLVRQDGWTVGAQ